MPTKLKIKMGQIEFDYEGDTAYDTAAVKELFTHIQSLMGAAPAGAFDTPTGTPGAEQATPAAANGGLASLAVSTVAARLKVASGPDMVLAAAAHLQICSGKESFSRKELLASMQAAKAYYKISMAKNLTQAMDSLTKSGKLNALANDEWALTAGTMAALSESLAQSG